MKPARGQRRVERRRRVTLAEDEAVPLRVVRAPRVDAQDGVVQDGQDVERRELAADVAEARLVDHAQVAQPSLGGQSAQLEDLPRARIRCPRGARRPGSVRSRLSVSLPRACTLVVPSGDLRHPPRVPGAEWIFSTAWT